MHISGENGPQAATLWFIVFNIVYRHVWGGVLMSCVADVVLDRALHPYNAVDGASRVLTDLRDIACTKPEAP